MGIETQLTEWQTVLTTIGTTLSVILIIAGGIVYGISQGMPSETRGKWVSTAVGLIIGGIISEFCRRFFQGFITSDLLERISCFNKYGGMYEKDRYNSSFKEEKI